jgi:hypothetical protein
MVDLSYQMVLSTLQTAGILVGITYYLVIMRNSQKTRELVLQSQELTRKSQEDALETRQVQLFMNIYKEHLTERESRSLYFLMDMEYDDFEDYERKYGRDNNPEAHDLITMHQLLMEGFGILVREGYVNVRLVALFTSGSIRIGWEKLRNYIYETRERYNFPRYSIEYEYLYNTLMEYAEKHPELQII